MSSKLGILVRNGLGRKEKSPPGIKCRREAPSIWCLGGLFQHAGLLMVFPGPGLSLFVR